MSNIGRPKGKNNKEYVYSLRMDERTKTRLETYCRLLNMTKSEVIRFAIDRLREENDYGENMGVTIMKMGSIQIEAETEDEAIKKAEHLALLPEGVNWEDSWNAVDVCKI